MYVKKNFLATLVVMLLVLSVSTYADKDNNKIKNFTDGAITIFNAEDSVRKNTDFRISAIVNDAKKVTLYYKNNSLNNFKKLQMKKNGSNYYTFIVPNSDTIGDYIEYYIEAHINSDKLKTKTYKICIVDVSISPETGMDDTYIYSENNGDITTLMQTEKRIYFNDIAANDHVFNGFNLNNFNQIPAIPEKYRSTWPEVNSKWNLPRTVGWCPHKGLDFDIRRGETVVPMFNGAFHKKVSTNGIDNYVAVKYDLDEQDHTNSADLYFYYWHVDPKASIPANIEKGSTDLGTIRDDANHLHLSVKDKNGLDLPWYYFLKNIPSLDYGYKADLIHGPTYSGSTVTFKGYVYELDDGWEKEKFKNVYITYETMSSGTKTSLMSNSGDEYSYTFPSQYSGEPVAYYLTIYREGYPSGMEGYSPAYYNIYDSGSGPVSTPPDWSVAYETFIP